MTLSQKNNSSLANTRNINCWQSPADSQDRQRIVTAIEQLLNNLMAKREDESQGKEFA